METTAQQDPTKVVALIEGKPITAQQAWDMLKVISPQDRQRYSSDLSRLLQELYMRQQFAIEAEQQHLDQQAPVKEQIEMARNGILAQAYVAKLTDAAASGATPDPKQYYDSHPDEFKSYKISGIFVAFTAPGTPANAGPNSPATNRTEEAARTKATDLLQKLKTGADFGTLAKSNSDNAASAAHNGELGTITGDAGLPPDMKTAIFKLKPGEYSDLVRQPNGFYIFKLDSATTKPFDDQTKDDISKKVKTERGQAVLKTQYQKYQIDVKDPNFFDMPQASRVPSLANPSQNSTVHAAPPAPATH